MNAHISRQIFSGLALVILWVACGVVSAEDPGVSRPKAKRPATTTGPTATPPRTRTATSPTRPESLSVTREEIAPAVKPRAAAMADGTRSGIRQAAAEEPVPRTTNSVANQGTMIADGSYDQPQLFDESMGSYDGYFQPGYMGGGCCPTIYASAEALLWWTSGDRTPPLVTTSPAGTAAAAAGALNNPNTTILFGNEPLGDLMRGGERLKLGMCLSPRLQVEGAYFALGSRGDNFNRNSTETAILARPFLNIVNAIDDHQRVAFAGREGTVQGSVNITHSSRFQGADALGRFTLVQSGFACGMARVQMTGGYRYLSLHESLGFQTNSTIVNDPAAVLIRGTQINLTESFDARNTFHGGDIGFSTTFEGACYGFDLFGRVAIGGTHQVVTIDGSTTTVVPNGGTTTRAGGLLAQPTNIGTYTRDQAAFVPHFGAQFHYQINPCWRFNVGYDFMFWSNVIRPGEQIDTAINTTQFNGGTLAGARRPAFQFNDGSLWAQGISLGLDCRF